MTPPALQITCKEFVELSTGPMEAVEPANLDELVRAFKRSEPPNQA